MFYDPPYFTLINMGKMIFSLFVLALLIIIPVVIYNLGSKLDRISQQLENIGNLLRSDQFN
jgi:hypothetical protein